VLALSSSTTSVGGVRATKSRTAGTCQTGTGWATCRWAMHSAGQDQRVARWNRQLKVDPNVAF
jgi:hypothetical protein